MRSNVDHMSIRAADKETANTPRFIGELVHDLVAAPLRLLIGGIDVVGVQVGDDL